MRVLILFFIFSTACLGEIIPKITTTDGKVFEEVDLIKIDGQTVFFTPKNGSVHILSLSDFTADDQKLLLKLDVAIKKADSDRAKENVERQKEIVKNAEYYDKKKALLEKMTPTWSYPAWKVPSIPNVFLSIERHASIITAIGVMLTGSAPENRSDCRVSLTG